jgi:hypothetical protein
MKFVRRRLTYANVMSSIAVFLVLAGGTAFAANQLGKNTVGSKQLKKNAVTAAKIKNEAVTAAKVKKGSLTGTDINLSTLGKVPSAAKADTATAATSATTAGHASSADTATTAGHASTADTATNANHATTADSIPTVHVFKAGAVQAIGSEATSPKIQLGSVGSLNFYGKCYEEGGFVVSTEYIELTTGFAYQSGEDASNFESNGDGYLTPATPENERILKSVEAGANDYSAQTSDEEFTASASDGTEITGEASNVGAKNGNPTSGNGPFLASNSCILGPIAIFGG